MPLAQHIVLETTAAADPRRHLEYLFWLHDIEFRDERNGVKLRRELTSIGSISFGALRCSFDVDLRIAPSDCAYRVKFTLARISKVVQQKTQVVSRADTV